MEKYNNDISLDMPTPYSSTWGNLVSTQQLSVMGSPVSDQTPLHADQPHHDDITFGRSQRPILSCWRSEITVIFYSVRTLRTGCSWCSFFISIDILSDEKSLSSSSPSTFLATKSHYQWSVRRGHTSRRNDNLCKVLCYVSCHGPGCDWLQSDHTHRYDREQ
jgi:hypothetical protein